jgi:hypothetical protein
VDGEEVDPMRPAFRALNYGASAGLTVVIMAGASLLLWIGVPAAWLWIGSQIQGSTGSLGLAILVMFAGSIASIVGLAWVLGQLGRAHDRLREARGQGPRETPLLEMVLVITAGIALVVFVLWFFVLTGPGPQLAPSN